MPKKSNNNLCAFFKLNSFLKDFDSLREIDRSNLNGRGRGIDSIGKESTRDLLAAVSFIFSLVLARVLIGPPILLPPPPPPPPCTCTERVGRIRDARGSEGASNGAGRRGGAAGGRAEEEEGEGRQGGSGGRRAVSWRLRTVS